MLPKRSTGPPKENKLGTHTQNDMIKRMRQLLDATRNNNNDVVALSFNKNAFVVNAHRWVLCTRSPVFANILSGTYADAPVTSTTKTVVVPITFECEERHVRMMLEWLYCGTVSGRRIVRARALLPGGRPRGRVHCVLAATRLHGRAPAGP
eukprot:PhM_4_TR16757/c0_g2_i1/m.26629